MKRNSILICLLFAIFVNSFIAAKAQAVNTTDSLALVDLYNSTNGPNWNRHNNWLTTAPVSTWFGIKVIDSRVLYINLNEDNLNGAIPASFSNLSGLDTLYLAYNNLNGPIPASIYNLANLSSINLSNDHLTGAISADIGNLINLTGLSLSGNQLTGTIPAEIGNLTAFIGLNLSNNQLSGNIPATLGNLTNLTYADLEENELSGTIPATLGNLKKLGTLYLNNNQLSGAIPAEIGNLTGLYYLGLNNNLFTGSIPAEIGNLTKLYDLYLSSNQLSGTIPATLSNCTKLNGLYLYNNQLSGTVPASLKKLNKLRYLDISYNRLSKFGYADSTTNIDSKIRGSINNNLFTFDGLQVIAKNFSKVYYAPQDTILPIHQNGNILSVSAGGVLSKNTYKWYKIGGTNSTIIKSDSTFTPTASGKYFAKVTNAIATKLTLYSDTINYTMPLQSNATFLAENTAGIKSADSKLLVYPNPAKDVVHIQTNGKAMITVTNSAGKIIFSKSINNDSEINVSSYANGTYYLQNKTTGETQKVVVVH